MNPEDTLEDLAPPCSDTCPPDPLASTIPAPPPDFSSHPFYPIALDDESLEDD